MLIPSSLQDPVDARNAAPACRVAVAGVPRAVRARLVRAFARSAALPVSFTDVPASEAARGAEPWALADIAVTWHGPPAVVDATPLVATRRQATPIGPVVVIVDVGGTAPSGLAADPSSDWITAGASTAAIHDAVVRALVRAGHPTILAAAPRVIEHLDRCDVGAYRTNPSGTIVRWLAHCRITRLVIDGALAGYLCVLADVTDARRLERDLSAAITRHQRLIDEAHSRVRTSLDALSGMLDVYAPADGDPAMRSVMRDTRNRIQAIAILHDWLQQAPGKVTVSMRGYLERLVRYLAATCAAGQAPAFECRAVPLQMPVTTATRIGLIVNELAVNAMKYAFDNQDDARVVIALSTVAPARVVLEVSDNGRGLPAHVDPATATSLGLRLVSDLASSIGATVEITRDAGTTFRLTFAAER